MRNLGPLDVSRAKRTWCQVREGDVDGRIRGPRPLVCPKSMGERSVCISASLVDPTRSEVTRGVADYEVVSLAPHNTVLK